MNVKSFHTVDYENIANWKLGENKPNTNPIQTQSNPISPPPATKQTQFKPNQTQFQTGGNHPRSVRKYFRPFLKNGCIMVPKARWAIPRVSFTLNHLCLTWFGHGIAAVGAGPGRRFHAVTAILGPGRIIEVGLINLVPGNLFAGVTGDLTHHGYHCAADHVVAVIDGLAGANRLE